MCACVCVRVCVCSHAFSRATVDSKCMQDEIFGPILPVIVVDSVDDAVAYINRGGKPLALYAFGSSAEANSIVNRTSSGGAVINDVCWHCGNSELPFGGVGLSGIGAYVCGVHLICQPDIALPKRVGKESPPPGLFSDRGRSAACSLFVRVFLSTRHCACACATIFFFFIPHRVYDGNES